MREFKFRAWDKINNQYTQNTKFGNFDYSDTLNGIFEDENFIFEQFIGLKDRNGKEIYEGDITYHHNHKGYCEIVWSNKWSCFHGKPLDKEDINSYFYQSLDSPHIEIEGNIHQNKIEEFI